MTVKPSILFLDDDEDTRELVEVSLGLAQIKVSLCESRGEAWKLANEHWFELFLLDGLLPNGDSFGLCADLRDRFPHTPIVFYSGLASSFDIQRGFDAGATAYLTKPFEGDLAAELRSILETGKHASAVRNTETPHKFDEVTIMDYPLTADENVASDNPPPEGSRNVVRGRFWKRSIRTAGGLI